MSSVDGKKTFGVRRARNSVQAGRPAYELATVSFLGSAIHHDESTSRGDRQGRRDGRDGGREQKEGRQLGRPRA